MASCQHLKRPSEKDKEGKTEESAEAAGNGAEEPGGDESEESGAEESAAAPEVLETRVAAMSATPFFDSLETLADGSLAKPSRYLNRGARVAVLQHDRESGFSRVSLSDQSVGYVPSRLLFKDDGSITEGDLGDEPSPVPDPESLEPDLGAAPGGEAGTMVRPPLDPPPIKIPEPELLPPGDS